MRHLKAILFAALLVLALSVGLVSAQNSDVTTTLTARAKLRYGPGLEWYILGYYDAGTPIRLDGQAYDGSWVRGILPDGQYGWVIQTAVALPLSDASSLRTVWVDDPFTLPPPAGGAAAPSAPAEDPPAEPEATPEQEAVVEITAPQTVAATSNLANLAFAPVAGPYTMPLPGLDATDPQYDYPFKQWGGDDGRINYGVNIDGMAVYCVNADFVPEETYRNGGILVKTPAGASVLYVPVGTIAAGYQQMLATRQNTLLGTSTQAYNGQPVALYLLNSGEFQVNFINSSGGMSDYQWSRCRPIPRATGDGCPPGWDIPPWGGDCVHQDFDGVPPWQRTW